MTFMRVFHNKVGVYRQLPHTERALLLAPPSCDSSCSSSFLLFRRAPLVVCSVARELQHRIDITFTQAAATLVTAFTNCLAVQVERGRGGGGGLQAYVRQLDKIGYLCHFESLLSTPEEARRGEGRIKPTPYV